VFLLRFTPSFVVLSSHNTFRANRGRNAAQIMKANGIKTVKTIHNPGDDRLQANKGFRIEEKMFVKKASWQAS
jgi:hypothetical protein